MQACGKIIKTRWGIKNMNYRVGLALGRGGSAKVISADSMKCYYITKKYLKQTW